MSLCSRLSFHRLDLSHQFVNLHIVVFLFTMRKSFESLRDSTSFAGWSC